MRDPSYEAREREASEKLFKRGALLLILACHSLSLLQWLCYALGGSFWGG